MAVDGRKVVRRLVALGVASIATYYAVWGGEYSAFDLRRLRVQQGVEAARFQETRTQVDSLQALIERLQADPATIEAVARERFGMVRDGEILYRFVDVDPTGKTSATP